MGGGGDLIIPKSIFFKTYLFSGSFVHNKTNTFVNMFTAFDLTKYVSLSIMFIATNCTIIISSLGTPSFLMSKTFDISKFWA